MTSKSKQIIYYTLFIPPFLNQDVNAIAILIYGSPEVVKSPLNLNKYLIKVAIVTQATASLLQGPGVFWSEVVAPIPDGLIGDHDATFRQ